MRYAFVGDSFIFGQGVTTQEALPARAERYVNEVTAGWPAEVVNLGVCGYNIWNEWLSFKNLPQVYDGVVLVLCINDAELLQRSLGLDYAGTSAELWEPEHPFRSALTSCCNDIVAHCTAHKLRVAVCFYDLWRGKAHDRVSSSIGGLCSKRQITYVDFLAHFEDRNIALKELCVSDIERHPSSLAHDAAARHLINILRGEKWFEQVDREPLTTFPQRVRSATESLVQLDAYPRDAALDWAARTLKVKTQLARRQTAGKPAAEISSGIESAAAQVKTARDAWQSEMCMSAVAKSFSLRDFSSANIFRHLDEDLLRLDELRSALALTDWPRVCTALPLAQAPIGLPALQIDMARSRESVAAIGAELSSCLEVRDATVEKIAAAWPQSSSVRDRDAADVEALFELVRMTCTKALSLQKLLNDCESQIQNFWAPSSAPDLRAPIGQMHFCISRASASLNTLRARLMAALTTEHLTDTGATHIELTLQSEKMESQPSCLLEVQTASLAPQRLPLIDQQKFVFDGLRRTFHFSFPQFFLGQVVLTIRHPRNDGQVLRVELAGFEIYNSASSKRSLSRAEFDGDELSGLTSPQICLV